MPGGHPPRFLPFPDPEAVRPRSGPEDASPHRHPVPGRSATVCFTGRTGIALIWSAQRVTMHEEGTEGDAEERLALRVT